MDGRTHSLPTDRACPLGFVVTVAFATGLVWLCAILQHLH
jgi:hypothetical protein